MKILVLTDFSKNAENALEFALELALKNKASISILNCFSMPYSKSNVVVSILDRLKKDAEEGLKNVQEKIKSNPKFKDISIKSYAQMGELNLVVNEISKNEKFDLIVMGTKGLSAFEEIFVGSNTSQLIKSASLPILAIPENFTYHPFNSITYASDLLQLKNLESLKMLKEIALLYEDKVSILHVSKEGPKVGETKKAVLQKIQNYLAPVETQVIFENKSDIVDGVSTFLKGSNLNLLVMVSRKHSLFERIFTSSNTELLSYRTTVPLLSLPDLK